MQLCNCCFHFFFLYYCTKAYFKNITHFDTQHAMERKELMDIMQAVEVEEGEREAEARQEQEQLRE